MKNIIIGILITLLVVLTGCGEVDMKAAGNIFSLGLAPGILFILIIFNIFVLNEKNGYKEEKPMFIKVQIIIILFAVCLWILRQIIGYIFKI